MGLGTDLELSRLRGSARDYAQGPAPRQIKSRRECVADGCPTVLSIYNRAQLCWLHQPRSTYRLITGRSEDRSIPATDHAGPT